MGVSWKSCRPTALQSKTKNLYSDVDAKAPSSGTSPVKYIDNSVCLSNTVQILVILANTDLVNKSARINLIISSHIGLEKS